MTRPFTTCLSCHLLAHDRVGVVESEEESSEGDDAGAVVEHEFGEEQQEELDVLLHRGRDLAQLYEDNKYYSR